MRIRGLKNVLFIITKHFPIIFNIFGQTVDGSPAIFNFIRHVYIMEKSKTSTTKKKITKNDRGEPNLRKTFPFFQTQFNNSFHAIINFSANEFNYGFKIRDTFSNFTEPEFFDLPTQRLKYRQKTADAFAFVNVKTKMYYDSRRYCGTPEIMFI